ncbi:MAG: helix-turn-helix transcriptional regulator [Acidobacteriota bacterium]|nr:helix-turn-helix transcriptional regulator [Acidobacteriota bacterium]
MARRGTSRTGELGRPNEPAVLILTSLAAGPKHGYALARDIGEFAGVTLGPGTLYGAITRLEERGLIEATAGDDRRRPYRLTAAGRAALAGTVRDMRALADVGARRLGLRALLTGAPRGAAWAP